MKLLALLFFVSFNSFASVICTSESDASLIAKITVNGSYGHPEVIAIDNIPLWVLHAGEIPGTDFRPFRIKNSEILEHLKKVSQINPAAKFVTLDFVSSSAADPMQTTEDILQNMENVGAGIAFLAVKNKSHDVLNGALYFGAAGYFNNCKTK